MFFYRYRPATYMMLGSRYFGEAGGYDTSCRLTKLPGKDWPCAYGAHATCNARRAATVRGRTGLDGRVVPEVLRKTPLAQWRLSWYIFSRSKPGEQANLSSRPNRKAFGGS